MRNSFRRVLLGLLFAIFAGTSQAGLVTISNTYGGGAIAVNVTVDMDESVRNNFGTNYRFFFASNPSFSPWLSNLNASVTGYEPLTFITVAFAFQALDGVFDGSPGDYFGSQFLRSDGTVTGADNFLFENMPTGGPYTAIPVDPGALVITVDLPTDPRAVPEPTSLALVGLALLAATASLRRANRARRAGSLAPAAGGPARR